MSELKNKEKPEVYALHQDGENWLVSRRDFLKAAGIGAAVLSVRMGSRFVRPASAAESLETLCRDSLAHSNTITHLFLSPDGENLVSRDTNGTMKCWNFENYALTGTVKNAFSKNSPVMMGYIDNKACILSDNMLYYELPLTNTSSSGSADIPYSGYDFFTLDAFENFYAVKNKREIHRLKKADHYGTDELLYTLETPAESIQFLEGNRKIFVQMGNTFGVLDPEKKTMNSFGGASDVFAVLPGESRVLFGDNSVYRMVSLSDGSTIWEKKSTELDSTRPTISGAGVTPDGSMGILCGVGSKGRFWLISLADGSCLKDLEIGERSAGDSNQIVTAKDGSKFALAVGKSILFISLPEFEIIGCPVDLTQMKDTSKGVEIKEVDSVTGQTITYTLPCGAPIPEGAVCVCNCVAGSVCSCVGHTVCTCDTVCSCVGYSYCSCNTVCTCDSEGGHYWHPN